MTTKGARAKSVAKRDRTVVVGYCRVSTDEQAVSGLGLADQEAAIRAEADRRGWELVLVVDAGTSASETAKRPKLDEARALLAEGRADVLMVAKFDRLARSVDVGREVIRQAMREDWRLVIIDMEIDTSTTNGKLMATMFLALAEWERDMISDRTKAALAVKRAQGIRLGRPSVIPSEIVARIVAERQGKATLQQIADGLMADQIPTARGGSVWHANTIRKLLGGQDAAKLAVVQP